jgi:hypothetical protein
LLHFEQPVPQIAEHVAFGVGEFFDAARFTGQGITRRNDTCRDADGSTVCGDVFDHDRTAADPGPTADGNCPQHTRTNADNDIVLERWVTFAELFAGASECDTLVEHHVVADFGCFTDDGAHAMVDEKARPDGCTRMYFDTGQKPSPLG